MASLSLFLVWILEPQREVVREEWGWPRWGENRERENIAPYENQILALAENLKPGIVSLVASVDEIGAPGAPGSSSTRKVMS